MSRPPNFNSKIIEAWNAYAKAIKSTQDMDAQIKGGKDILVTKRAQLDDAKAKFDARVQAALSPSSRNSLTRLGGLTDA